MTSDTDDVVGHFRVAYETVVRFPLLFVPPLAVAVLAIVPLFLIFGSVAGLGALGGWMQGGGGGALVGGVVGMVLGILLFMLVMSIGWLLASGMVVVMARDALAAREPVLGDALSAVVGRLGPIVTASFLVTAAVWLGFLFLVIPGFVAMVLLVFTIPAVLLDGLGAVAGMKRSVAVVRQHVGPVIGLFVGSLLVMVGFAVASWIVGFVPFVGGLAAFVLPGVVSSNLTVVFVRFYRTLAAP
jgi:hypothetical protein